MSTELQVHTSYRSIIRVGLPIAVALLIPQLNLITNSVFLGYHSEKSLALASLTGIYYLVFAGVGFGLNNGLQTLLSRRAGQNRPDEIGKIFSQGVLVALLCSLAGILITFFLAPAIFRAVVPYDEAKEAIDFLKIRILGLPFLFVYQLRNALLVSINRSKLLVLGTLAEALANVFFDYTFIFGKLGFPEMGFSGAAVASVLSEFIGMVTIFIVISMKGITRTFSLFSTWKIELENFFLILKVSGPLIFQHGSSVLAWLFFYILVARNNSQTDLAISTTMRAVFGFFGAFFWSLAATTNSMVSNVIGQGRRVEVLPLISKISRLSLLIACILCLLLQLFPQTYLSLFRPDAVFIASGIPVLRTVGFALIILSVGTVWLNGVTGTGNTRMTFLIEIIAIILYCAYVFFVLEIYHLSVTLGWASELLYWSALLAGSYYYLRSMRWQQRVI